MSTIEEEVNDNMNIPMEKQIAKKRPQ